MTGPNPQIGENGLPVVNRYITKINSEGKAILASEPDSLNVWQRIGKVANFFLGYTTRTFPTSLKDDNDIKSYAKDFGEPPGLSSKSLHASIFIYSISYIEFDSAKMGKLSLN